VISKELVEWTTFKQIMTIRKCKGQMGFVTMLLELYWISCRIL